MKDTNRRLLTPALVIAFCAALLLGVILLATRDGAQDDSAAIGFPVVLVGLAIASVLGALAWKAVAKRHADHR